MRDLIKRAMIGAVMSTFATATVSTLTGVAGEPEHSIVRSIRGDGAPAVANPRCAPRPIKMPCLQSSVSPSRAAP